MSKTRLRGSFIQSELLGKRKSELGILQPGAGAGAGAAPTEDPAVVGRSRVNTVTETPVATARLSCLQQ